MQGTVEESSESRPPEEKPPRSTVVVSGLEPVPVEGCKICGALAIEREAARRIGNVAKVRMVNAEISNHPHPESR